MRGCPAEAVQAEASTRALQGWLNRGPFRMTHRLDESHRPLRPRACAPSTACAPTAARTGWRIFGAAKGGARSYWGGGEGGWC